MEVENLLQHLNKYVLMDRTEFQSILLYFNKTHLKKKEMVQQIGEQSQLFFVLKGCLQMYYTSDKGINHTTQFALENWWMSDMLTFTKQQTSTFNIQAVEKSTIVSITPKRYDDLLINHPKLERYFRIINQIGYGAGLNRLRLETELTKEEKYIQFITLFPQFAQRVPQYLIASFLGLTPEYVSEIRAKIRS